MSWRRHGWDDSNDYDRPRPYFGPLDEPEQRAFRPSERGLPDGDWTTWPGPPVPGETIGGHWSYGPGWYAEPGHVSTYGMPPHGVPRRTSDYGSWSFGMERRVDREHGMFEGRSPKNYSRSDARIREDVCDRLTWADLDVGEVEVTVEGGEVTLTGVAPDRKTKRRVGEIADECFGVRDVHNRIKVDKERAKSSPSDKKGAVAG
jgi:hypothetical protein